MPKLLIDYDYFLHLVDTDMDFRNLLDRLGVLSDLEQMRRLMGEDCDFLRSLIKVIFLEQEVLVYWSQNARVSG